MMKYVCSTWVPNPLTPQVNCLPSDEWLDDHQQGLQPGSSEPKHDHYVKFKVMPKKPSILDMMHNDMEEDETVPPQSPERALTPTIDFGYDYTMDEPPVVQRITEMPRHSTPHPEPPTLSARPKPASQLPQPRASSVPPTPNPAKRKAVRYQPVTEEPTPPITPPRAHAVEQNVVQDTPSPVQKPEEKPGPRHVARPSENLPWHGNTQ